MGGERASGTDAGGARWCLALTLLAFLARAGLVVFVGAPTWDEAGIAYGSELGHIARNLAEGRGFSSPFEEGSTPTAWIAPAVPALWALVFRALGTFSDASLTAILALQCLASALAVGIYGSLARRMALASGGSRRVALVLGVALALWPESILGLRRPWYFGFQELGVALLVWRAVQGDLASGVRRGLLFGVVLGLVALVNPVPLFLAVWIALAEVRRVGRPALVAGLAAAGASFLVVAPWMWRSHRELDAVVPVRSNFGVELLQGNGERPTVRQTRASVHPALDAAERERFDALGEVAYSREARERAVAAIRADVPGFALRTLQRVYLFWCTDLFDHWLFDGEERVDGQPATPPWWRRGAGAIAKKLLRFPFVLAPLALLGVAWWRSRHLDFPYAPFVLGVLVVLPLPFYVTHVHDGYSTLIRPYLVLAAVGLFAFGERRRGAEPTVTGS